MLSSVPTQAATIDADRRAPTVAHVVQHLHPGGLETLALDLAGRVNEHGRGIVISLEGDLDAITARWPRTREFRDNLFCLGKRPGLQPGLAWRLARLFHAQEVAVVHTHHVGPLLYAGLAARLAGVPTVIHTEHDAWHLEEPRRRTLQRAALTIARPHLVADADEVADSMRRHLGDRSIRVIRNGVDTRRFRPGDRAVARQALDLPPEVVLIGSGGRLEPVKGHAVLLEAMSLLDPGIHLALAGSGSLDGTLRQLAQDLGIAGRVHFLGHVDDMPRFYQALDLFCLPSFNEGMPLSLLEAQACGVRAAATDVGGTREALCPATGTLLEAGKPASMASSLGQLAPHPASADPRDFVLANADLDRTYRAYLALA